MISVEVSNLKKHYGEIKAVDGISFTVNQGEVFGLLGPNGAGKTTAIEIMEGLRERDGGDVKVLECDPWKEGYTLHKKIGVIPQEFTFFEKTSPREAIKYYADLFDKKVDAEVILKEVLLQDYYHVCAREAVTHQGEIYVVPAGYSDANYVAKLARTDLEPAAPGEEHPIYRLLRQIRDDLRPRWLLLDLRAGIAESAGFGLSGLAHLYVLFGTTSKQSWQGLKLVIEFGRGAMGIDVGDVFRLEPGVGHGVSHGPVGAVSLGIGGRHVVGVAGEAVAHDLGIDARPALVGMLQGFQDQDRRPFRDDEAVTALVEWPRGLLGLLVARGQGTHGVEAGHAQRGDGVLGSAGDHDIGFAALDDARGIADGMGAGGAGGAIGQVGSLEAELDGDLAGGEVGD